VLVLSHLIPINHQRNTTMSLTKDDIQKTIRIKRTVTEYFANSTSARVEVKDLMQLFVTKNIFPTYHKEGLPIKNFLKHLDKENHLHLIPHVHFEQKEKNKNWFFIKK
jgi:hypothetical protein